MSTSFRGVLWGAGLAVALGVIAQGQTDLTPAAVRAAADYARSKAGLTLVIWQNGRVVLEENHAGSLNTAYELASGTKTFSGVMAAAAVADGFLRFDERAADTLTEWQADARKSRITVRNLLDLSSGLRPFGSTNAPTYAAAVASPAIAEPGAVFVYDPVHFQAFGELLQRKLVTRGYASTADYARRRVLDRIGCVVGVWRNGTDGNPLMPQGAQLTAREWIKFGELLRLEGRWNGQEIIPAAILREVWQPSAANPAYGLTAWLNRPLDPARAAESVIPDALEDGMIQAAGSPDIFMAAGLGDQRLYIIPKHGVVVARQAPLLNLSDYTDERFLDLLLPAIPPAALVNVSTRGRAGAGGEALIGGFVITGDRAKTVLVRAAGPALAAFGVAETVADPRLRLFDSGRRLVKENDRWGASFEAAALPGAFARVGAFAWPTGSADAALLVTLVPGAYTAEVTPSTGSPGIALVEVYEMPAEFRF
jgi:CubicO group peptidase (beta-lactamase class C family)